MMECKTALAVAAELRGGRLDLQTYVSETAKKITDDTHNAFLRLTVPERPEWLDTSPLSGAAVSLSDDILVKGELGTAGSKMLHNFQPPYGATLVSKLDAAGLVRIGKTNLPEFGIGEGGRDAFGGPVVHPCAAAKISEGGAAAVALGLVPLALSVDRMGSARKHAAMAGVVCLKPTYGTVSRFGLVPFIESAESVAITAGNMADVASLFQIIAGHDEKDGTTYLQEAYDLSLPGESNTACLEHYKVALPREFFTSSVHPEVAAVIEAFCVKLRELGAEVREVDWPLSSCGHLVLQTMAAAEGANNISRYDGMKFGYQSEQRRTVDEIYFGSRSEAFGIEAKRAAVLGAYVLSKGKYEAYYLKALQIRRMIHDQLKEFFREFDLLLTPPARRTAYDLRKSGEYYEDHWLDSMYTAIPSLTGVPAAVLPAGLTKEGMPVGVQIMADTLQETKLLHLAAACGL